ncbi:glycosyltransferase [Actinoplanes sp. TFC3]|uniref:glycosyltransferase n=1 Tax=Actinoplanes sp. TFC3 TaxID=1710355 RepID=UPI00083081D3|nr:glycosyltransferase [Actinoplanes sp. TFC3]
MTSLLVASTGGHLAELHDLAPRLGLGARRWVTFDSPQSRSLLAGEDVVFVPPATSRDVAGVLRDLRVARRMLKAQRYDHIISTGASVAMAFFLPGVAAGIPCSYIESATRTQGPSLTGRLAARVPGIRLFTQYPSWADGQWQFGGSIFDAFEAEALTDSPTIRKVVVTLGTHERYTFPRLLNRLVALLPAEWDVLWQVGATVIDKMPAGARRQVPIDELRTRLADADVVISHAGVGSALAAMQAGKRALYVPRRKAHGEHVDDHQVEMARELESRKLVVAREAEDVTLADLHTAAGWSVRATPGVTPFKLNRQ